jgi:hypothetical protein
MGLDLLKFSVVNLQNKIANVVGAAFMKLLSELKKDFVLGILEDRSAPSVLI